MSVIPVQAVSAPGAHGLILTSLEYALDEAERTTLEAKPVRVFVDDPAELH